MTPFLSIITPTIQRESLVECCRSVDEQVGDVTWEHIIIIDDPSRSEVIARLSESRRTVLHLRRRYANFGNTPRHVGWHFSRGVYHLFLDDDNYLMGNTILQHIHDRLHDHGLPDVAVFPIQRHGNVFSPSELRRCHIDTANFVVKRELAQWPNVPDYDADGMFAESLPAESVAFIGGGCTVCVPHSLGGQ